ncbi:MAG: beta-ketoacyl-[acyl-carrier-protein] synthase family protein [Candidatus Omnitrophica bacterium]|nr:beta-ketoacyl-[acyl-carrier-protein] synthase family protein [Candidatus Omnitrophota bacterium]
MSDRRVAITGLGLVTPCGEGWMPYWKAVLEGESSIRPISGFPVNGFPVKFAGEISGFNPAKYARQRKSLKLMSREIQLAIAASGLAIEDAGLRLESVDRTRFGISLGVGIINNDLDEVGVAIRSALDDQGHFQIRKFGQEGIRSLYPLWLLKYMPNMPACHVSIAYGLRGASNTITTSAAAGAQAVGEAYQVIQRGDADLMLAGGSDSKINAMGISRFHLLGLLSYYERGYCPFDERHDGMVLGEGSGILVLEDWEHAKARGARIYGEIVGYGSSSDYNYDPRSTDDFNGKRLAMLFALRDAQTGPEDVDFLLANGSGIPSEDIQEARAVQSVFENFTSRLQVTATKPITGHLVYGAGGVEIAAALLSLEYSVIPPIAKLEKPDPECDLPFVKTAPQTLKAKTFLFNSFGFGGQNASVVVRKECAP